MQFLEAVSRSPSVSWYRLLGEHQGEVNRWVASTPESIRICNCPELCGVEFSNALRTAMTSVIATAPFAPLLRECRPDRITVMNFLRGSLNFDVRSALYDALGVNLHATCFMSSQRFRKDGRWHVKEDMYRKIRIPEDAVLLFADVVATGVTVDNGLEVIQQHVVDGKASLTAAVFFTIGCHKIEKILEKYHAEFKKLFPGYRETHVVYLEAKLRLVDSQTKLVIAIPGTDLVKQDALLSPEFEASQYATLSAPLERCAIYDAGSRAFDVVEYLSDVVEYWESVRRLARRGYTLFEALLERWPERHHASRAAFMEVKTREWAGVSKDFYGRVWDAYKERWTPKFKLWAQSRESLECVCEDRLKVLHKLMEQMGRQHEHD
jgi:hypothetical protein